MRSPFFWDVDVRRKFHKENPIRKTFKMLCAERERV
jgi:hypothetical protein